jgi:hypothetical protein
VLTEEANVARDRFFLGMSRKFDWAKKLRWHLQKKVELGAGEQRIVSRNNAMRPPLAPLELLRYQSGKDTDILNEYYVPVQNFVPFMDKFRQILLDNQMNVMSSTVRYVTPNATPVLAYAPTEPGVRHHPDEQCRPRLGEPGEDGRRDPAAGGCGDRVRRDVLSHLSVVSHAGAVVPCVSQGG